MAYCRFGDGDVYLFYNVNGYYECCGCWLSPLQPSIWTEPLPQDDPRRKLFRLGDAPCPKCKGEFNGCTECGVHGSKNMDTAQEALEHLQEHRRAGHEVPEYAIESLTAEAAEAARKESDGQGT